MEDGRGLFDAGIGVDLDQPRVALVVKHEVIAIDLEAVIPLLLVQLLAHAQGSDLDDCLDHCHQLRIALALLVDQSL